VADVGVVRLAVKGIPAAAAEEYGFVAIPTADRVLTTLDRDEVRAGPRTTSLEEPCPKEMTSFPLPTVTWLPLPLPTVNVSLPPPRVIRLVPSPTRTSSLPLSAKIPLLPISAGYLVVAVSAGIVVIAITA
jgi:hypothetical protein